MAKKRHRKPKRSVDEKASQATLISPTIANGRIQRFQYAGSPGTKFQTVRLRLSLEPSLDLGLRIRSGVGGSGSGGIAIGDPSSSDFCWGEADELDRARKLLDDDLRAALIDLARLGLLRVDDELVEVLAIDTTDAWLPEGERTIAAVAELLDRKRDAGSALTPPAPLTASFEGWLGLQAEHGLSIQHAPLRLSGRVGDCQVEASTRRTGPGTHAFTVAISVAQALDMELSIERASPIDRLTALVRTGRHADRAAGDEAFDRAFDVRTAAPDALSYVLDAEVRRAVSACAAIAPEARFHDRGADFSGPCTAGDDAGVPSLVRLACGALSRMYENLRRGPPPAVGPYR